MSDGLNFEQLVTLCQRTHQEISVCAARAVDAHLVVRNWLFGRYIVEYEQRGADRADVAELSAVTTQIGDGMHGTPLYSPNGSYFFINGNNLGDRRIVFTNETQSVGRCEFVTAGDFAVLGSGTGSYPDCC